MYAGLYDRLRSEMQTSSQLSRLGLTGTDLRQVLQVLIECNRLASKSLPLSNTASILSQPQ
jgi:hypothetical protein